jgi:hypothetical protein
VRPALWVTLIGKLRSDPKRRIGYGHPRNDRGLNVSTHRFSDAVQQLAAAALPTNPGFALHELPLQRFRALLARARGDEIAYRDFVDRYRADAATVGFEGHLAMANAMTQRPPD